MSLVCFVVGIFSCMLFRNKAPIDSYQDPEKKSSNKLIFKEMFDFSIVRNWRFLLWVFIDILLEGGYNVPYFFLPCKLKKRVVVIVHCKLICHLYKPMPPFLAYQHLKERLFCQQVLE